MIELGISNLDQGFRPGFRGLPLWNTRSDDGGRRRKERRCASGAGPALIALKLAGFWLEYNARVLFYVASDDETPYSSI